jgi:branched-chain amino acid aminotransferase
VLKGKIYTPPLSSSVLPGITRDTVITIARELGLEVLEDTIPREMLYVADEVFFTGTAAEITPIKSIDKIPIGQGKRGPITARIQNKFYAYINGEEEDRHHWLTYISTKK